MIFLTRKKVLELIKQAVMFAPVELGAARPNSYAIINELADFNQDNLGYKANDPDVWTRQETTLNDIQLEYPIVCPIIYGGARKATMGQRSEVWITDDLRILVADRFHENKEDSKDSEARSITAILDDTDSVVNMIMEYLDKVSAFKVEVTTGNFVEDFYNENYLVWCKANNKILDYTVPGNLAKSTSSYVAWLNRNINNRIERLDFPSSKERIVGTYINLTVDSYSCHNTTFSFYLDGDNFLKSRNIYLGK